MNPVTTIRGPNADVNRLAPEDRTAHEWYRFVLSFPPHLVRDYLQRFGIVPGQRVLDPFCGTGTTLVECKKLGIASIGVEANPLAAFAARVKVDWSPDPERLLSHALDIARTATEILDSQGLPDIPLLIGADNGHSPLRTLPPESMKLLLTDSINSRSLHRSLVLIECLDRQREENHHDHQRLALARALVFSASNLCFGPEVGVGPKKLDAPVIGPWLAGVRAMAADLHQLHALGGAPSFVHHGDSRCLLDFVEPKSVDAVITSPPYPNEKDYTRTTRLESVVLGCIRSKADLRALKKDLVRSNTRGVYKDDRDDQWVRDHPEITRLAEAIEDRRIQLGKTSGFERMYARVTKLYFGGMARHLAELRSVLRPGARLAYVVGDQASYLRVMIRTGQLLTTIAEGLGYRVMGIDLFRTRLATATREQLREEVVLLRWPG